MRLEAGVYVPLTILIDTAANPYKTVEKLYPQKVFKLIIKDEGRVVEEVYYNNYWKRKKKNKICKRDTRPACFNRNTYSERLKRKKLRRESNPKNNSNQK